jgi:hypothetical protein
MRGSDDRMICRMRTESFNRAFMRVGNILFVEKDL